MLVHPDKNMGNEKAVEAFKKLQNAYEVNPLIPISFSSKLLLPSLIVGFTFLLRLFKVLLDSVKRKAYDDELRREELLDIFRRFQSSSQKV